MNMLDVKNLKKYYPVNSGFLYSLMKKETKYVKAVDEINFSIGEGEIIGLAGESGSGKTTTGEIVTRLQEPTSGQVLYQGQDTSNFQGKELKNFRKLCQMIFQDPYETLNPRFTIRRTVEEPLLIHGYKDPEQRYEKVKDAIERAELRPAEKYMNSFPHELSGGQRQRVAIARAIVLDPILMVADEPVSMLDVSIRAGVLNLLKQLREDMGLSMLYVSHDLSTIKYICDRTIIMYLGRIVETGPTNDVIDNPVHPYTQALISSVPVPDPDMDREGADIEEELPDQIDLPSGCRFWPRCNKATEECKETDPELRQVKEGHYAACILIGKEGDSP
ncbi:ABC transporter ATP-binding protein [Natranaerobius thermophilus]|uniref:Oligopeptide/dipeptide ABC transporter, ATPase subunit n=1 Tax=Natranaerobius thermophilus (strain ATCC BAA-1301 / DSM 18059 / JW/NM-WN-LF) TaxID=457570 RepID=B2A7Z4_NATTJ|nr:ABC transporter ATP-binding protein [Natranaerobius thermophilus]ACB85766.1 oligopeptide/dipeptide ABC transporter, ATPase subunit [Natranaerobius thermophilus JW/NM-WN-LF]